MEPKQHPGSSEQSVQTPPAFLDALRKRLHILNFDIDLAADETNHIASKYYTKEDDAILQTWKSNGWAFCNPPFNDLTPWVQKAHTESSKFGAQIAMLTPASVGSNWFKDYVFNKATVLFLSPRLTFLNHKNCYPKDLILLLYTPYIEGGFNCWKWNEFQKIGK